MKITPKISEIRAILIGLLRYEGIYAVAAENLETVTFSGLNNGATAARLFGVKSGLACFEAPRDCSFKLEELYKSVTSKIKKSIPYKWQLVYLLTEPEALVFLIRPVLSNPVIIVLKPKKNIINFEIYTAKTIFSGLHLKRLKKYAAKKLPNNLSEVKIKAKEPAEEPAKKSAEETSREPAEDEIYENKK